jgi:Zinc knuckle
MNSLKTGVSPPSWSDIVRRGQETVIPATRSRQLKQTPSVKNVAKVIFEAEGYTHERRSNQAARIIKRALHADTVLFEFNSDDLEKEDAYDLISESIGEAVGFRPISEFQGGQRGNLLIEAKFVNTEDSAKACNEGVAYKGVQYYATPSIEGADKHFVKVNMSHLPLDRQEELKAGLLQSMVRYGRVCQIKLYTTARGYFEGEGTVILDCTATNPQQQMEALTRMIYLEKWDNYYPATFLGAPPVCYMCRLSGHIKKDCPELAKIRCFKCNETGHMRHDCPKKTTKKVRQELSESKLLDQYIELTRKEKKVKESDRIRKITPVTGKTAMKENSQTTFEEDIWAVDGESYQESEDDDYNDEEELNTSEEEEEIPQEETEVDVMEEDIDVHMGDSNMDITTNSKAKTTLPEESTSSTEPATTVFNKGVKRSVVGNIKPRTTNPKQTIK